uniref:Uncharacterized protein n=1 Tax=Brassica oleracea TaxID=3712 RepID=A0A3P6CI87_BRAOL|nr:unnamed protein product [Brassica oleracea]
MERGCYQGDRHGDRDVGDFHLEEDQSPQHHPLHRHDRGSLFFDLLDMIEDVVRTYKAPIFLGPASPQNSSPILYHLIHVFYDALDPTGNITIKWDIISWTADGYVAVVSIFNFQQYRNIQAPGWQLGWSWYKIGSDMEYGWCTN